jgi:transposase
LPLGAETQQLSRWEERPAVAAKAAPAPDEPTSFIGVDLGIVNLAADNDGETYSGAQVQAIRERRFITYKARQAGVVLVAEDRRNTSRTCPVCGHCEQANRPDQAHFHCQNLLCGHTAAADTNAAVNIAQRAARQTAYRAAPASAGETSTSPFRLGYLT